MHRTQIRARPARPPRTSASGKAAFGGLFALAMATLLAGAPAGIVAAHAQTNQAGEIEALRAQLKELQTRLDALEAQQKQAAADQKKAADTAAKTAETAARTPAVTARQPVTLSGLLQAQSLGFFGQSGPGPRASDTFRLRRGELRVAGSITPRVTGTVMIDPAKTTFNRAAGPGEAASNTIRARDNPLQEIQLSYLLRKAAEGSSDNLYLDFGQFKIPVGYESLLSSSALPLIERALMFTARDPFDGGYGDVRDTGLQLRGTQGPFDYRLGVFNGFGDRQNTLAISDAKAVLGMLSYRLNRVKGLQVGVSGGRGNTGIRNSGSLLSGPRANRDLFNLFAAYKGDRLSLQAEYLTGEAQGLNAGAGGFTPAARDLRSFYGSIGYLFTSRLEGILRYDFLDADAAAAGDTTVRDLILGLNYYIKGNNAKIQANLLRRNGAADLAAASGNPTADLRNDRTELRVQGQIAF